jgi:nitroreductase
MMSVTDAIRTLRAVRRFGDAPLPEEAVRAVLNAGRRAQSSKNVQPWQFVAVRDKQTLQQLSHCGDFAGHLAGAALGVVLCTPASEREAWVAYDLGQATAYMQLAAWELGIGSCIAAMYEPEKAGAILGVPSDYAVGVAISFGYSQDEQTTSRPPRAGGRRPLDELVHWDRW